MSATGIACRGSGAFVTDAPGDTFCTSDLYVAGTPTRAGEAFGFDAATTVEDLDNTVNPKLSGDNFHSHVNGDDVGWFWEKANGVYTIRLALGGVGVTNFPNIEVRDGVGGTILFTVQDAAGSSAGQFYDATGVKRTSAADWISNNAGRSITITTGLLVINVKYLSPLGGGRNSLSYVQMIPSGGSGPTPQPIRRTSIVSLAARQIVGAVGVRSIVGFRALRGAPQRTKVALPVIVDVQIKPIKGMVDVLPYPWKGALVRKPRPYPDIVSTRTPPPRTRSIVLPHMLKGAPARKPFLFPETTLIRIPGPLARTLLVKRLLLAPPTPARVIIDPFMVLVRTRAPLVRFDILPAMIQHPTTGSAAPILSMIELDLPATRFVVGRKTILPPPPPAPSRARPITIFTRTPRPVTETIVGIPRPHFPIAASRFARPLVVVVRTPKPSTDSLIAVATHLAGPIISRARPLIIRVRMPLLRVDSFAGSGIERGPAVALTRAIPQYTRTLDLADATHVIILNTSATRR
jgi:hypothetical protein